MITKKFLHQIKNKKLVMAVILLWPISLIFFCGLSYFLMILGIPGLALFYGIFEIFSKPILYPDLYPALSFTDFLKPFLMKRFYVLILVVGLLILLLRKKRFFIATIISALIPPISLITFLWLEIHLYKQKKWLWFWYVMTSYIVLCGSGYYFFTQISQQ